VYARETGFAQITAYGMPESSVRPVWPRSYNEAIMQEQAASVGLCFDCVHAEVIQSDRGSVFHLCRLSATDPGFPKYPRLPVRICRGYESSEA
jgi:hypothetical protein